MIKLITGVNLEGSPCVGFEFQDMFITNPYMSECGRFGCPCIYYGVTEEVATAMTIVNRELQAAFCVSDEREAPPEVIDGTTLVLLVGSRIDEWQEWRITQNLSDRWGELVFHEKNEEPLKLLEQDKGLLQRLVSQMWDECTFIVRKDGKFGVLYEVEYSSIESDAEEAMTMGDEKLLARLRPQRDINTELLALFEKLSEEFPGVQFAVPHPHNIVMERPAAWAFVPDGLLNDEARERLGRKLLSF